MTHEASKLARNGEAVALSELPAAELPAFRNAVVRAVSGGGRISALFAVPETVFQAGSQDGAGLSGTTQSGRALAGPFRLVAAIALPRESAVGLITTRVGRGYPALTPLCNAAHEFEREIYEQWGIIPEGHPWLKPVRFIASSGAAPARPVIGDMPFFRLEGDEIHEVAVGPVHAGVIEPGHFRFQCHGEHVFHLEISLGYQHRGIERALIGGPAPRTIHYMETAAGDTTIGHSLAYAQAIEGLSNTKAPARAHVLRGIALELERLANHTGDLGALAGDVGFLPTAAFCGRIRGDFLNMSALICGSRFGRGIVRPGGAGFDLDAGRVEDLDRKLEAAFKDVSVAADLLWKTPTVLARFEETGTVSGEMARQLGLVGVAARACGMEDDVRQDFPSGIYRFAHVPISTWHAGDVFSRAFVRWMEIGRSVTFIREHLRALPDGDLSRPVGALTPQAITVSLVEGWRGEICHVAVTDIAGAFSAYKIVDPSFHNWMGLAMALRDQQISDFPLCNKSFNLSYCGHDL